MSLSKFFSPGRRGLSFELFPPKSDEGVANLMSTVSELVKHSPDFFTCTYGAGGSTQERTLQIIDQVKQMTGCPVASHLTCVGSTKDDLRTYLRRAAELGVDYIVALRGDPPKGETKFVPTAGGLAYANELVSLIRAEFKSFEIAVAGYPEVHQEAIDAKTDLENLKRKVDAGAQIVVTQLFYKNEDYFRFCDNCAKIGINIPIVPGIMPVTNLAQIQRITSLCKASLPTSFVNRLAENDSVEWQFDVGVEQATEQCRELIDQGIPGIHFYVLNKSQATGQVLDGLDMVNS
jgi:methylenetetrahydrofolate reductase (NADPH)